MKPPPVFFKAVLALCLLPFVLGTYFSDVIQQNFPTDAKLKEKALSLKLILQQDQKEDLKYAMAMDKLGFKKMFESKPDSDSDEKQTPGEEYLEFGTRIKKACQSNIQSSSYFSPSSAEGYVSLLCNYEFDSLKVKNAFSLSGPQNPHTKDNPILGFESTFSAQNFYAQKGPVVAQELHAFFLIRKFEKRLKTNTFFLDVRSSINSNFLPWFLFAVPPGKSVALPAFASSFFLLGGPLANTLRFEKTALVPYFLSQKKYAVCMRGIFILTRNDSNFSIKLYSFNSAFRHIVLKKTSISASFEGIDKFTKILFPEPILFDTISYKDDKLAFPINKIEQASGMHYTPVDLALVFLIDNLRTDDALISSTLVEIFKELADDVQVSLPANFLRKFYALVHTSATNELFEVKWGKDIVPENPEFALHLKNHLLKKPLPAGWHENQRLLQNIGHYFISRSKNCIINAVSKAQGAGGNCKLALMKYLKDNTYSGIDTLFHLSTSPKAFFADLDVSQVQFSKEYYDAFETFYQNGKDVLVKLGSEIISNFHAFSSLGPLHAFAIDDNDDSSNYSPSKSTDLHFIYEKVQETRFETPKSNHLFRFIDHSQLLDTECEDLTWIISLFPEFHHENLAVINLSLFEKFQKSPSPVEEWEKYFQFLQFQSKNLPPNVLQTISESTKLFFGWIFSLAVQQLSEVCDHFKDKYIVNVDEFFSPYAYSNPKLINVTRHISRFISQMQEKADLTNLDLKTIQVFPPIYPTVSLLLLPLSLALRDPRLDELVAGTKLASPQDLQYAVHPIGLCCKYILMITHPPTHKESEEPEELALPLPYCAKKFIDKRSNENLYALQEDTKSNQAAYKALSKRRSNFNRLCIYLFSYVLCSLPESAVSSSIQPFLPLLKEMYASIPAEDRKGDILKVKEKFLDNPLPDDAEEIVDPYEKQHFEKVAEILTFIQTILGPKPSDAALLKILEAKSFSILMENITVSLRMAQNHSILSAIRLFYQKNKNEIETEYANADSEGSGFNDLNDLLTILVGACQVTTINSDILSKLVFYFSDKTLLFVHSAVCDFFASIILFAFVRVNREENELFYQILRVFFDNSLTFLDNKLSDCWQNYSNDPDQAENLISAYLFLLHQYLCTYREIGSASSSKILHFTRSFEALHFSRIMSTDSFANFFALKCCIFKVLRESEIHLALEQFYQHTSENKIANVFLRNDFCFTLAQILSDTSNNGVPVWEVREISTSDDPNALPHFSTVNTINCRSANSIKPEIIQIVQFIREFTNDLADFKKWFLEHMVISSEDLNIPLLEIEYPSSRCLTVNYLGVKSDFYYCFSLKSMFLVKQEDDTFVTFKVPSFDDNFQTSERNNYLGRFTHSLTLVNGKNWYGFSYRNNEFFWEYSVDASAPLFLEFHSNKNFPMLTNEIDYRLASREVRYEGKSVFSIIARDRQNNLVEIFPQFIQDNGQYLSIAFLDPTINGGMNTWNHTSRHTIFYNLDSFKAMEIRSNGKIWLVKFDCTNNFFGSEFNDGTHLLSQLHVFEVSEQETNGTAVLLFHAPDRINELYLVARYMDAHQFKHAFLKLISIHLVYELTQSEINIIAACLKYLESRKTMTIEVKVIRFYLKYLLYRCMISFGTSELAVLKSSTEKTKNILPVRIDPSEMYYIWQLIPLYAKASLYQAVELLSAIKEKKFGSFDDFHLKHDEDYPNEERNYEPYGKKIIEKCKNRDFVPSLDGDFSTLYSKISSVKDKFLGLFSSPAEDIHKENDAGLNKAMQQNFCYSMEDAFEAKLHPKDPDASKFISAKSENPLMCSLKHSSNLNYQIIFSDLYLVHFSPVILNAYKRGLDHLPFNSHLIDMQKYALNVQASVELFRSQFSDNRMSVEDQLNLKSAFNTFVTMHKFTKYPRDDQWLDILKFIVDLKSPKYAEYKQLMISKMMGGGKTAVIGQILGGLVKTDGKALSVMYFIDELYNINVRQLTSSLAPANISVLSLDFLREEFRYSPERLNALRAALEFSRTQGHLICMKISSMQGLINKFNETLNKILRAEVKVSNPVDQSQMNIMANSLLHLITFCKKYATLTIDEAEKALNPNIELNFPLEESISLDGVYIHIIDYIVKECHSQQFFIGADTTYVQKQKEGYFLQLIKTIFEKVIPPKLIGNYIKHSPLSQKEYEAIEKFCFLSLGSADYEKEFENISNILSPTLLGPGLQLCNFLRRELGEWLKEAVEKKLFEDFGPCPVDAVGGSDKWKTDTFQAIPYEGANKPATKSRFSSPYWSVNLALIMYNEIGIPQDRFKDFLLDLQEEAMLYKKQKYRTKSQRYLVFVDLVEDLAAKGALDVPNAEKFPPSEGNSIALSKNIDRFFKIFHPHNMKTQAFKNILQNPLYKNTVLLTIISLLLDCKFRKIQINSFSLDIYWSNQSTEGYSGTLGNYFAYARNIKIDEVYGELGMITNKLLDQDDADFFTIAGQSKAKVEKSQSALNSAAIDFVSRISKPLKTRPMCILDVGAHFKGMEDRDVCKVLFEQFDTPVNVAFFNKDSSMEMITKDGTRKFSGTDEFSSYLLSLNQQKNSDPVSVLVFHPQTACTGVDLKYHKEAQGLLLIYPSVRGIDFKQAALRLRELASKQTLIYGIAEKLDQDYQAWDKKHHLPKSCFVFLDMLRNEVKSALAQSEAVAFHKVNVEGRCIFFDFLSQALNDSKGGPINFLGLFGQNPEGHARKMWKSLFLKPISLEFPEALVYEVKDVQQIISDYKEDVVSMINQIPSPKIDAHKKAHIGYLDTLISHDLKSANISRQVLVAKAGSFQGNDSASKHQMLAEEENLSLQKELVQAQREQMRNMVYDEKFSPFRESIEDTSSLKAFVKALKFNCRTLIQFLRMNARDADFNLPQFPLEKSDIFLTYHFWRVTREFSELSYAVPEKVNSGVFVICENKRLKFFFLSSMQIHSVIQKTPDITEGYVLISPLGDLIHSPHSSLSSFLDWASKGDAALKRNLDQQFDYAIFQIIFYNQLGISIVFFCDSFSILGTPRILRFVEWISMPGTPENQLFILLKRRSIHSMEGEIGKSELSTLLQEDISKFFSYITQAHSDLQASTDVLMAMESILQDSKSWQLFSIIQHFYRKKINLSLLAVGILEVIIEIFDSKEHLAKFKIDHSVLMNLLGFISNYYYIIERSEDKSCAIDTVKMESLFTKLFDQTSNEYDLYSATVQQAIRLGVDQKIYHSRFIAYVEGNLVNLLRNSTDNSLLAEYVLYEIGILPFDERMFHRSVIVSIVEVLQARAKASPNLVPLLSSESAKMALFYSRAGTLKFVRALKACQCYPLDSFDLNFTQLESIFFLTHALGIDSKVKGTLLAKLQAFDVKQIVYDTKKTQHWSLFFMTTFQLNAHYLKKALSKETSPLIANWVIHAMEFYNQNVDLASNVLKLANIDPQVLYQTQVTFALAYPDMTYPFFEIVGIFSRLPLGKDLILKHFIQHATQKKSKDADIALHLDFIVKIKSFASQFEMFHLLVSNPKVYSCKRPLELIGKKFIEFLRTASKADYFNNYGICADILYYLARYDNLATNLLGYYNTLAEAHFQEKPRTLGISTMIILRGKLFFGIDVASKMKALHLGTPKKFMFNVFYTLKLKAFKQSMRKNFVWYLVYLSAGCVQVVLAVWMFSMRKDWARQPDTCEKLEDLDFERVQDVVIVYDGIAEVGK